MAVRAIAEGVDDGRPLSDIVRRNPAGEVVTEPMEVHRLDGTLRTTGSVAREEG